MIYGLRSMVYVRASKRTLSGTGGTSMHIVVRGPLVVDFWRETMVHGQMPAYMQASNDARKQASLCPHIKNRVPEP